MTSPFNNVSNLRGATIFRLIVLTILLGVVAYFGSITVIDRFERLSNSMNIGIVGEPKRINPLWSANNSLDSMLSKLIYRSLISFDQSNQPVGDLAESWDLSEDGKTYTVRIKPDQFWHDGKEVVSHDVAFTYQLLQNEEYDGPEANRFKGVQIEAVDDHTLTLTLEETFAPFLESLYVGILPKHVWEGLSFNEINTSTFNLKAIGSGPYRIEEVETDGTRVTKLSLLRVREEAHVKKANLLFFPNETQLSNAYKLGELDLFYTFNDVTARDFLSWGNALSRRIGFCGQTVTLFFNLDRDANSPVNNDDFKRALYSVASLPELSSEATFNPVPESNWAYSDIAEPEMLDEERIKQIFSEMQIDDPIDLTITQNETVQTYAKRFINKLKELGAPINLIITSPTQLEGDILPNRNFDMLMVQEQMGHDPDQYNFWHSSQTDFNTGGLNASNYASRKVDLALEEGRTIRDQEERKTRYITLQEQLIADKPAIFISHIPLNVIERGKEYINQPEQCLWHTSDFLNEALVD